MKTRLFKFIFTLLIYLLAGDMVNAQEADLQGSSINNSFFAGTFDKNFIRRSFRFEMANFSDTYHGTKRKEVFISFELKKKMRFILDAELYIANTDSTLVFLFNSEKELIYSVGEKGYSNKRLSKELYPGIYYLACEAGENDDYDGVLFFYISGYVLNDTTVDPDVPDLQEKPENYMPSANQNYIRTISPLIASDSVANFSYLSKALHRIEYYDQLGRPVQTLAYKASPTRKDMITHHEYDGVGRDDKQWLPIVRTNGTAGTWIIQKNVASIAKEIYQDSCAYSRPVYDGSSLNRIKEYYNPGEIWQSSGHGNKNNYRINTIDDRCLFLSVGGTRETPSLIQRGIYSACELEVVSTENEDGYISYAFTDKQGYAILNRYIADNDTLDTYRVYDDYGNLCFVLPPAATDHLSTLLLNRELPGAGAYQAMLDKYAYQYRYDYRNRCIGKKLPGCAWQEMIYDTADRLLFTRDGNQKKRGEWNFQLSDLLGRSVLTGLYHGALNASNYDSLNVYASFDPDNASALYGYVLHYPAEICPDSLEVLKANYYDTYDYKGYLPGFNASLGYVADENYGKQYTDSANLYCKGLLTGSVTRTLESGEELFGCYYYDYNQNLIQSRRTALNGVVLVNKSSFNFSGKPIDVCEEYGGNIALRKSYVYDHSGRLTRENHICGNDTTVFLYSFDEIGRMKSLTRINGKGSLATTNSYNIRDWLTGIESPDFKQTLHYTDGAGTPCYNGNVSSMTWQTDTLTTRGYQFSYDGLSRLKDAVYGEGTSLSDNSNRFNEQVTAYDKMGNILGLKRYGQISSSAYGLIDNLSLSYDGNQLQAVNDKSVNSAYTNGFEFKDGAKHEAEYFYDANGNLIQDLNKKIADIQYNCLNLPSRIQFENGNIISNLYDADGSKLRTAHVIDGVTTTTDYCDNAIYENGVLDKLLTEQGYITLSDAVYHYFLRDHQGNNRVVVDRNGTVEEVNHYYPFGGIFASTSSVQPYKYNGKELDRKGGLDWYDYGSRMYDAAFGRWHVVDLLSENTLSVNPYNYCLNNPFNRVDPDGMASHYNWGTGQYEDERGNEVSWESVQDEYGIGSSQNHDDPPSRKDVDAITGAAIKVDPSTVYTAEIPGLIMGEPVFLPGKGFISLKQLRILLKEGLKSLKGINFETFRQFKSVFGGAGKGKAWHHIVEQTPGNVETFGARSVQNTDNLIKLPHGPGSIHEKISAYYSSKPSFTNGLTVREWLSTRTFQEQYDFGIKKLKEFGWKP